MWVFVRLTLGFKDNPGSVSEACRTKNIIAAEGERKQRKSHHCEEPRAQSVGEAAHSANIFTTEKCCGERENDHLHFQIP